MQRFSFDFFQFLIQLLPIVLIWVSIESRISKLEGKIHLLCSKLADSLEHLNGRL